MPEQEVRYASIGARRVAWASSGDGPPLVMGGWWVSHLELDWREHRFREFTRALGEHRTVIRYDRPGTGLSDRDGPPPATLDDEVELLAGVVDELGADSVDFFAVSSSGPVVASYAASRAAPVGRLVFYGSYANGQDVADEAAREAMLATVRTHWGLGSRVLADVFLPAASAPERIEFAHFQRQAATSEIAARSLEAVYAYDARDRLERVDAPVRVIHRRSDRAIPFELGQDLASRIPGASFVALEGQEHQPWRGDAQAVARAVLEGLGVENPVIELELPPELQTTEQGEPPGEPAATDLSDRELEVLKLVALGLSDREIAEQLIVSPHTVHRHVANIRNKLRLPSRAAAAAHATRLGLI